MQLVHAAVQPCVFVQKGGVQRVFISLRRPPTEAGKQLVSCFSLHGHNGPIAGHRLGGGKVDGQTCKLTGSARRGRGGEGR